MAVVNPTSGHPTSVGVGTEDGSVLKCVWLLTTADFVGQAVKIPEWSDQTWHMTGTFGAATVVVETAPVDTDAQFSVCKNAAGGAAIGVTVQGVVTPIENSQFMRPKLSVVGAGASITVTLIARRGNSMRT